MVGERSGRTMHILPTSFSRPQVKRIRIRTRVRVLASLLASFASVSPASASATSCAEPAGAAATFHAAFTDGTMVLGRASSHGLRAKACGAVIGKTGSMVLTIQPGNIAFQAVSVKILFIHVPATITVNTPLSGPFKTGPGLKSAEVSLSQSVGVVHVAGLQLRHRSVDADTHDRQERLAAWHDLHRWHGKRLHRQGCGQ